MTARLWLMAGLLVLASAWAGPLPQLARQSLAAHMALHMSVVGIGVPLVAAGIAAFRRPGQLLGGLALPIAVSLLDFVVIWSWHSPALHLASRNDPWIMVLEQASFAAVSLLVWLVALSYPARGEAALAGAATLFFTSMHMTLLGALLGLAPRPLYDGHVHNSPLDPLVDQQLGGIIMLAVGGTVYLIGGLVLVARVLRPREAQP
ncbi:MAG TPA: cytochrome c oxidase assembly protein [Devosia sp.]|nr:cytochrome c oxidase assembly protein [Devosia sp.]